MRGLGKAGFARQSQFGRFGQGLFERKAGLCRGLFQHAGQGRHGRVTLGEQGQLVQGGQAQIVQKLAGGGKQAGTAHRFAVANDFNPATVFQLLDDLRADGHAPDVFHVSPGDRLTVGNDGQGLQHGAGVFGGLFGVQAV